MSETDDPARHGSVQNGSVQIGAVRALIGLTQGVALYGLFEAFQNTTWPATDGPLFAPLCATAIFVPLIVVLDLTQLRPRALAGWVLLVTLICAGLAWYDIYRDPTSSQAVARNLPSPQLCVGLALGLFVGHSLLIAGANDARFIARYSTYFGISWKYGLQAAMGAAFVGVFWLVIWLGTDLFKLIKIDAPFRVVQKAWFWIPATTIALTYAIHMTDVRVGIIRGLRTLSCTLLAWLLPLLAFIAAGFLAALPFTGLEPLWSTRRASSILLVAAASLIFLINAAYQDGVRAGDVGAGEARSLPRPLRWSIAAASVILTPIVLLAAYGISLRVRQYGWTPERVVATACVVLAAPYAAGYAIAGFRSHISLSWLETTNVVAAFAIPAIVLALLTPLADPARISVADQIARLKAGTIAAEKFDYTFLRFGAGRFGVDALRELAGGKDSTLAAEKSADALQATSRRDLSRMITRLTADERADNVAVVRPKGEALPRAFLEIDWQSARRPWLMPRCLVEHARCDAVLADLNGDGIAEIIMLPSGTLRAVVFSNNGDNKWSYLAALEASSCPDLLGAIRDGHFKPVPPIWPDLDIAGRHMQLVTPVDCSANP